MLRLLCAVLACAVLAACSTKPVVYAEDSAIAAVSYRDGSPPSLTLITVINNRTGSGAHTGLLINASERVLFDPAGSFVHNRTPERHDVLYGMSPVMEQAYKSAHARSTFHVVSQKIIVTPEQAEMAYRLALQAGPIPDAYCTSSTTSILRQIPGFESLSSTMFPKRLMEDFERIPGVETTKYYEDDDPDLQAALRDQT
ncbi:hypothetical protein [Thalassococcus sp. S3]|uniref:hypothetical protein n=1 Tax=Thalassococcus sp. S3 TaxID=2017482 RepID=UPI0010242D7A|nr:hypothetical protein [Thalassococcus sp. S3]QBF33538.1 hypothetical protein CFI11_20320 [Thalassococcus sp. S3]